MKNNPLFDISADMVARINNEVSQSTAAYILAAQKPLIDATKFDQVIEAQLTNPSKEIASVAKETANRPAAVHLEFLNQLYENINKNPVFDELAERIQDLAGMRELSESISQLRVKYQDANLVELAQAAAQDPEVKAAVSQLATDNSHEDLEEAGLIGEDDEERLDEIAMAEFEAVVEKLRLGVEVDWKRVKPIVMPLLYVCAAVLGFVNPSAGLALQVGTGMLDATYEAVKKKE